MKTKITAKPLQGMTHCNPNDTGQVIMFGFKRKGGTDSFACHYSAVSEIIQKLAAAGKAAELIRDAAKTDAGHVRALVLDDVDANADASETLVLLRLASNETGPLDYAVSLALADKLIVAVGRTADKLRANSQKTTTH